MQWIAAAMWDAIRVATIMWVGFQTMGPALVQAAAPPWQGIPALWEPLDPVAGNQGYMWLQLTPAGRPSEVRVIAENRTGAFESVLLGLTT